MINKPPPLFIFPIIYKLCLSVLVFTSIHLRGQELDTGYVSTTKTDTMAFIEMDTTRTKVKNSLFGEYPSPKTALAFSLVIPGAGQFYNKKYWKIPIIYGGFGYLAWRISENRKDYVDFRDAYAQRVDGDSTTVDIYSEIYSTSALKFLRDARRKGLESNYIFTVLFYLLNGVDAYVDAHLLQFDVSEDLSLKVNPTILHDVHARPTIYGISVVASF